MFTTKLRNFLVFIKLAHQADDIDLSDREKEILDLLAKFDVANTAELIAAAKTRSTAAVGGSC